MTMQSQEHRISNQAIENSKQGHQSGVTLLLAVLVLSAITAISFSLSAIVLVEIRASGDLQRTEPALYATQGVIEQSIFKVQRNVSDTIMCFEAMGCTTPIKSNINVVSITNVTAQDKSDSPIIESVAASYNTFTNTKNVYAIYDSDNPNSPVYGYTRFKVENRSANQLNFTFCQVNYGAEPTDCTPPAWDCGTSVVPPPVTPPTTTGWSDYNSTIVANGNIQRDIDKTGIFRLFVYQQCTGVVDAALIRVYSWGPVDEFDTCTGGGAGVVGECLSKGLPLKGKKQVDITAANAGLTRRYRVLVPLTE